MKNNALTEFGCVRRFLFKCLEDPTPSLKRCEHGRVIDSVSFSCCIACTNKLKSVSEFSLMSSSAQTRNRLLLINCVGQTQMGLEATIALFL
jgi:hypothetical protein